METSARSQKAEPQDGKPQLWALAKRLSSGATGPLLSFVALFGLPVLGAVVLDQAQFAFWSLLATIATVALSLDFGGMALVTARYYSEPRGMLLLKGSLLSSAGALIVGGLACAAWVPYSGTAMGQSVRASEAIAAILAMSAASAIRSILMVIAQAALVASSMPLRNFATAGHAFAAAAVTILLLFNTQSFWALPLGWLISGVTLLFVTIPWARKVCVYGRSLERVVTQSFSWRSFAGLRTLSTITSSAMMNSDRWIIGALGGPALLAAYEVAWRFAALPRFLVINLVLRVAADTAGLGRDDRQELRQLLRGSTIIAAFSGFASCFPVALAYACFMHLTGKEANWALFIAILVALTFSGLTAPLSFSGAALGNAWLDIPYTLAVLAVAVGGAVVAADIGQPQIFIGAYLGALVVSVCAFFLYAPALVRRGLTSRETRVSGPEAQDDGY